MQRPTKFLQFGIQTLIRTNPSWNVRVVPNGFPALLTPEYFEQQTANKTVDQLFQAIPGIGSA